MTIQCQCGTFRAELTSFPRNTPGRLVCYCDDCQTYAHHLGRADVLDAAGGTEIVPAYPSEVKIVAGKSALQCTRLYPDGMFRWSTACCNTPIANVRPGTPWAGFLNVVYNVTDSRNLERTLGPIRSRIQGRFARGTPPSGTPAKMDFKAVVSVMPFMLKGALFRKMKASPFFEADGVTPIVPPYVLSADERSAIRRKLGFE